MKTIQIELKDIKSNPFKKEIDGGKLNEEQVKRLMEGYKQTIFHENILARQNKKGGYELVYGHHRLEAAKRVYGKNYKISLNIVDYNDEQMIIDLCRENLTQRYNEFRQEMDAVLLVKKYLRSCDGHSQPSQGKRTDLGEDKIGSRQIAEFLSKEGKVINYHKVSDLIRMHEKLPTKILDKVRKHEGNENEESVTYEQARLVSTLDTKKEMEEVLDAVQKTKKESGGRSDQMIKMYQTATEETKEKVRKGELEISDIPIENLKNEIRSKIEADKEKDKGKISVTHFKQYQRDAGNKIGKTNDEIIKTCAFLNGLSNSGLLFELDWKTMLRIIEAGTNSGKNYTKFMEKILKEIQ